MHLSSTVLRGNVTASAPDTASSGQVQRLHELDSLRGLAALSVIFNHFQDMWFTPDMMLRLPRWQKLIVLICHPLYGGREAVMIFFVLSGFVLSLPYHSQRPQPYSIFILRRIARIYGPYIAALGLSLLCAWRWHSKLHHGDWAGHIWTAAPARGLILQHIAFVGFYNIHEYNPVFWSLLYEMRISLIFPLLMLCVSIITDKATLTIAFCSSAFALAIIAARPDDVEIYNWIITFHYLSVFLVGIVLAKNHGRFGALYRSLNRQLHVAVLAGALLLYRESHWLIERLLRHQVSANSIFILSDWLVVGGAVALIVAVMHSETLKNLLRQRTPLFLGRISYSLYLVHLPFLFVLTFLMRDRISPWAQLPLYVMGALLLGTAFHYAVERPFINLSKQINRR